MNDALAEPLARAVRPGRAVRLGAGQYEIAHARETRRTSWAGLRRPTGERAWQVRYITPVSLRWRNRTTPWPAPESVARGLSGRWQALSPATAPPAPGQVGLSVWVSDVDGQSEAHILSRRARRGGQRLLAAEVVSGFIGRIRYVCDHGTEADDFGALLAFATYAGAGSHTTYGFGVTCLEPTWQPPTLQLDR